MNSITMLFTIFTSTYNRAYTIRQLYDSLCRQTYTDFEWLIVDDGSSDRTEELIKEMIDEKKITINYVKQNNGGKHTAINMGVSLAKGDLFFIVDSDDQLPQNALKKIVEVYEEISEKNDFAGVCGLKGYISGGVIGGDRKYEILDTNSLEIRMKYKIRGDMAEVFRLDVLKQYPFPVVDSEFFCPEALIWNRIAQKYKLRYFNEVIYLCEYLPDGLTAKIVQIRKNSPTASILYYSELYFMPIPIMQKVKAAINYWRFSFFTRLKLKEKIVRIGPVALLLLPIGWFFYVKDLLK